MNTYNEERRKELLNLMKQHEIENVGDEDIDLLVSLENRMTDNRNMVVELNENGIIGDSELEDKIAKCFDIFLSEISAKFDESFCKCIYDYIPGERIGFLEGYGESPLLEKAMEVSSASLDLKKELWEHFGKSIKDGEVVPALNIVEHVSVGSSDLLKGINAEHDIIAEIGRGLLVEIETIDRDIMPMFSVKPAFKSYDKAEVTGLVKRVKAMKDHLLKANGEIIKLAKR